MSWQQPAVGRPLNTSLRASGWIWHQGVTSIGGESGYEAQPHQRARNPGPQSAPVPAMAEPVAAAGFTTGEDLQVIRAVEAATYDQADDHHHHPRRGAGDDQHGEGRYALHQVGGETSDKDEGNRHHPDQQRGLDPRQQTREHAGHVQPGAIQRRGAGGHAANHCDQAHRQEEPGGRHRQQTADVVVGRDVVRRLDRHDGAWRYRSYWRPHRSGNLSIGSGWHLYSGVDCGLLVCQGHSWYEKCHASLV